jgi:2-keto-myo-inositol isomerase
MIERYRFGLNRIICPSLDIKDFFQLTHDLGLQYVELRNDLPGRKVIDNYSIQEIRYLTRRYNIKICSINALPQFNYLEEIDRTIKELKNLLSLAKEIDSQAIVMCPVNKKNDLVSLEKQYLEVVPCLKELIPVFKDYSIQGYIEPLGFESSSLRSILLATKAIQEIGYDEGYKIVYDTFHHVLGPDDLERLSKEYDMGCTGLMHISAVTVDLPAGQYRDEHRNMDFKEDRFKNKEQIDFFIRQGYEGIISFEPFAEEVQRLTERELKELINQAITYLS